MRRRHCHATLCRSFFWPTSVHEQEKGAEKDEIVGLIRQAYVTVTDLKERRAKLESQRK